MPFERSGGAGDMEADAEGEGCGTVAYRSSSLRGGPSCIIPVTSIGGSCGALPPALPWYESAPAPADASARCCMEGTLRIVPGAACSAYESNDARGAGACICGGWVCEGE